MGDKIMKTKNQNFEFVVIMLLFLFNSSILLYSMKLSSANEGLYEPNDTRETAWDIKNGVDNYSCDIVQGYKTERYEYKNLTVEPGDLDWFSIWVPANRTLRIWITSQSDDILYTIHREDVRNSDLKKADIHEFEEKLGAKYEFEILGSAYSPYDLFVEIIAPLPNKSIEIIQSDYLFFSPNDSMECWWRIFLSSDLTADSYAISLDGNMLMNGQYYNGDLITYDIGPHVSDLGVYQVTLVAFTNENINDNCTILVEIGEESHDERYEPNDTPETAWKVEDGADFSFTNISNGFISEQYEYHNLTVDAEDVDYFSISVPVNGSLTVRLRNKYGVESVIEKDEERNSEIIESYKSGASGTALNKRFQFSGTIYCSYEIIFIIDIPLPDDPTDDTTDDDTTDDDTTDDDGAPFNEIPSYNSLLLLLWAIGIITFLVNKHNSPRKTSNS